MKSSAFLILFPLVAVLADQLVLHWRGECRKPLEAVLTGMVFYCLLLSPVFLCGAEAFSFMHYYYCVVIHIIVICEGLQLFMGLQFGMVIEPTLFAMMSMTSKSEIKDFFRSIFNAKLLLTLIGSLALSIGSSLLVANGGMAACRWLGYVSIALFVVKTIESIMKRTSYYSHRQRTFIQILQKHNALLQLCLGYLEYRQHFKLLRDASMRSPTVQVSEARIPSNLLGIVVIGESACRKHHSFYGYPRKTNPELEQLMKDNPDHFAVFDDAIAAIPTTPEAFEFMFTCQTLENNVFSPDFTLPSLLKLNGFWQAFYGAQPRFSRTDTSQALIFGVCDEFVNLNQNTGKERDRERSVYDGALLDYALPRFDNAGKPTALFLNLYGSHLLYRNRYPQNWSAPFSDDDSNGLPPSLDKQYHQEWNEYDNTIAYTDSVIAQLVKRVISDTTRPCFLLYLSDHGEVLPDGIHLQRSRKSTDNDAYEIPLVLVWNDLYRKSFPNVVAAALSNQHSPIQMDRFLPSFSQLFGISLSDHLGLTSLFESNYSLHGKQTMDLGKVPYYKSQI